MGVHRIAAIGTSRRSRSPTQRLVVLVLLVAPDNVVHRALGRGHDAEGAEERVDDKLRRLDVAGDHRRGVFRADHARRRHDHLQRFETARIERDVIIDQAPEDIEHRRLTNRPRRVVVPGMGPTGPREIEGRPLTFVIDGDRHRDLIAIVGSCGEGAIGQRGQQPPYGVGRVHPHVGHVAMHDREGVVIDDPQQLRRPLLTRCDLGPEISDVLFGVAGRVGTSGQPFPNSVFQEDPVADQPLVVEQHALFLDRDRVGGRRPRDRATDVGVMAASRHIEDDPRRRIVGEHRLDHRDIGQVGTTVVGGIEDEGVPRPDGLGPGPSDERLDRLTHRAQVNGHVRSVRHQLTIGVEDGTREVEPFLDVHRHCGVLEHDAHLLGDVHEEVVEDLELDRVGHRGVELGTTGPWSDSPNDQVAARAHDGPPTRFDHHRRIRFDDHRRAIETATGCQR